MNEHIQIKVAVVGAVMALLVLGGLVFANAQYKKETVKQTCYQQLAEIDVVAKIATATGVQPGVAKRDPIGTKYKVNSDYCKGK